jgi:DNA-directed RNA polymerase subunit RPC12/RpoP
MRKGLTFYRCMLCNRVVSFWDIKKGGCQHCKGRRIMPSGLTLWEKLVQIFKHPKIWAWPDGDFR